MISELIEALRREQANHGDAVVAIDDADTNWIMELDEVRFEDGRLVLKPVSYHDQDRVHMT